MRYKQRQVSNLVLDYRVHDWSGELLPLRVLAWGVLMDLSNWQQEAEFINWRRQPMKSDLWA